MTKAKHSGAFKGHRFPPEIIAYAAWCYFRFSLSLRDVEDLLATRGIIVRQDDPEVARQIWHKVCRFHPAGSTCAV
jgi:transposase-like protein